MNKFKDYKFNKLYLMDSGISSKPGQAGHGAPFVSFGTVYKNYFLPEKLSDCMDTSAKEQEIYSIKKGDILLTRTSETIDELGISCVALKDYPKATYSGFVKRLRPTQTDVTYAKYMGFYLRSDYFRKVMTNNAVMTLRASLNEDIFSYLNLRLPEYEEQKKIGDLLYLLNSKIELNNRINTELETMAKTIFNYWFIQFDFPNEKGKPYKFRGGKMVWNRELKRRIPVGWEVCKLSKYITSNRGVSYSGKDIENNGKPMINLNSFNVNSTYKPEGIKYFSGDYNLTKVIKPFDLVMCNTQQTALDQEKDIIGKSFLVPDIFDSDIVSSHHVTTITVSKEILKYYLNSLFGSEYFHRYISGYATGTNILGLNFEGVLSFQTVIPSDDLLERYKSLVMNVEKQKSIIIKEIQLLSDLLDWLLPMLVNGQVKVG